jgi:hypothetical protein
MMKEKKWWLIGLVFAILLLVFISFIRNKILFDKLFLSEPSPTVALLPSPTNYVFSPRQPEQSLQKYIEMAKDDLAVKLKINKEEIEVVAAGEKNWSNTSLGCPEKGKFYAEVITPGYTIELSVKDTTYIYHAGLDKVVSCSNG